MNVSVVSLSREVCNDLAQAEAREWWLADGLGGYAGGTVAGTLTRRYHGLLVAPAHPPLGRMLLLAKADATVVDGAQDYPLFANRWAGGVMSPPRPATIASFELDGRRPVWRFEAGAALVEQRIWMEPGAHVTYVAFRLCGAAPGCRLRLVLLANARDHHHATAAHSLDAAIELEGSTVAVRFHDGPALHLALPGADIELRHDWYHDFELAAERERGLADRDNHLCVAHASLELREDAWCGLIASLGPARDHDLQAALNRAAAHESARLQAAHDHDPALHDAPPGLGQLVLAADSFVIARPLDDEPEGLSVIAGYPWFGDWGRDTMIALPGLTLATGRADAALRILRTFARFVDRGMLPNVFPGRGETPEYNTVDAALWYFEAWRAYVEATQDRAALRRVYPLLQDMIDWHLRGTRYGIGRDSADGLLHAGEPGLQLTWMDAKVGDWVVTPRIGKPVEVNALWFNALASMAGFARLLRKASSGYRQLAQQCRDGFQRYLEPTGRGLFDVLDGPAGNDATLRPNQVFAVSLPHSPLAAADQARVVDVLERELLTPYGLRSLGRAEPGYHPRYEGGVWERDGAYHQGTVWAFLLGHYAVAEARVRGDAHAAQQRLMSALQQHLGEAGLGSISEIFDAEPPHRARGCPAQAWSVACTLEAWCKLARTS